MKPQSMVLMGSGCALSSGVLLAIGDRFLNKRNTALAQSYVTWDAGVAYRFAQAREVRIDGYSLNDQRDPVAESELGDAQYYSDAAALRRRRPALDRGALST